MTRGGGREKPFDQTPPTGQGVIGENLDRESLVGRYGEAMLRIGQLESQVQELTDELRLRDRQTAAAYAAPQYQYSQGLPHLEQKIAELQKAIDTAAPSTAESKDGDAEKDTNQDVAQESVAMRHLRMQIHNLSGQLVTTDEQLGKIRGGSSRRGRRGSGGSEDRGQSRRGSRGRRSIVKRLRKLETYQKLFAKYRYVWSVAVVGIAFVSAGLIFQSFTAKPEAPRGSGQTVSEGGSLISDIRVDSGVPWNSTGVIVSETDALEVIASGRVSYESQDSSSPDGIASKGTWQNGGDHASREPWMAPLLPGQSLIAKIGKTGEPFYIGRHTFVRPREAGELFLGINEESSGGRGDNAGSWSVDVRVSGCCGSRPERAPIKLEATVSDDGSAVVLSWSKLGVDVLGYNIYRGGLGVLGVEIAKLGRDVTEFVIPNSTQAGTVCVFMRPYDASGLRIASEQKCVDPSGS